MTPFPRILALLACTLLLGANVAAAQAPASNTVNFSFDGGAVYQSNADLKNAEGGFGMNRWFVSAGVSYRWNFVNSIGLTVGGGEYDYDFDGDTDFGAGSPWGDVKDFRISAPMSFKVSEKAIAFIIPSVRWDYESGADSGDSDTWGVFAAVAWRIREGLTLGPGFGLFSRLDSGSRFFPVLAIDWDINDRWNLSTGSGLAASQGPGLTLSYKATEQWKLGLSGRYESQEFRLDNEGVAPGGIGRDQSFPLVFSGEFSTTEKISFALFAGLEFGGKLKIKDSSRVTVEESNYDPALLLGATFKLGF